MVIWIALAILAAASCLPLLLALRRVPAKGAERSAVGIYRDQLSELDRDVERGLIRAEEATAARNEVARRLIRADASGVAETSPDVRLRNVAAVGVVTMPLAALALYLTLGSPGLSDQPLAGRLVAPASQDIAALVARVELQLKAEPNDGRGWDAIAPVYLRVDRPADAAKAYQNAIRLLGPSVDREIGLGEALVASNDGRVPPEARAAFERARALSPSDPKPRFYLALALEDEGKIAEAIAAWQALIADSPPDAAWVPPAKGELARLQAQPGTPPTANRTVPGPGPTASDVAASENLPPDARQAMIEGMVASLATRLQTESGDAQGWAQLVRSYVVLGRQDDARAALAKARAALAADAAKTAIVDDAARNVGLVQ